MKIHARFGLLVVAFLISCATFGQSSDSTEGKHHRVKTTWTGNGFLHAGIRPESWELDAFGGVPGSPASINGIHGSPTPVYLSVEQIGRFVYWNMDLSTMLKKKNYEFTQDQTTGFFKNGTEDVGTYQSAQASFLGSAGYLFKGRWGIYVGGRVGYDNTLVHYNLYIPGATYIPELGGVKTGYNFHLFFPFIRGMMRMSIYTDNMKNGEFNFSAKAHEIEFNYYLPFNKRKSAGMMLRYNHMDYATTNYLTSFSTLNQGAEIHFKRGYFQIGFIIPIFKELSPDACSNCSGSGYTYVKGPPCTTCGGSGSIKCSSCNGQGLIVNGTTRTCTRCNGSGKVTCSACAGMGTKDIANRKTCEICHGTGKKAK